MFWKLSPKEKRLQKKVLDLESRLEAKDRIIAVLEAERDALAQVVARDRARVAAESAQYSRERAEAEGLHELNPESNGRFGSVVQRR